MNRPIFQGGNVWSLAEYQDYLWAQENDYWVQQRNSASNAQSWTPGSFQELVSTLSLSPAARGAIFAAYESSTLSGDSVSTCLLGLCASLDEGAFVTSGFTSGGYGLSSGQVGAFVVDILAWVLVAGLVFGEVYTLFFDTPLTVVATYGAAEASWYTLTNWNSPSLSFQSAASEWLYGVTADGLV